MNKKLFFATLFSVFSIMSLNAMIQPAINYLDVPEETINKYIQDLAAQGDHIGVVGAFADVQTLPDGKKRFIGRIRYQNGWVKVEVQSNVDGKRDESFGPQGVRALEVKKKLF